MKFAFLVLGFWGLELQGLGSTPACRVKDFLGLQGFGLRGFAFWGLGLRGGVQIGIRFWSSGFGRLWDGSTTAETGIQTALHSLLAVWALVSLLWWGALSYYRSLKMTKTQADRCNHRTHFGYSLGFRVWGYSRQQRVGSMQPSAPHKCPKASALIQTPKP